MKKLTICIAIAILVSGCGDKTDSQLKNEAQEAVKRKLEKEYKPGECDKWLFMASAGVINKDAPRLVCDTTFNLSKGVVFSGESVYRHKDYVAVCGNVSGYTDAGNISAQYVYVDEGDDNLSIKKSKSSLLLAGGENNIKNQKLFDQLFDLRKRKCSP